MKKELSAKEEYRTMKSNIVSAIVLLAAASNGKAALEFSAYTQAAQEPKFVLTDIEEAHSSGWLEIGQSFEGCALIAFDRKSEVLSVRRGDATIDLPLKTAHVKDGSAKAKEIAQDLAAAKGELSTLLLRYRERHPAVIVQRHKIDDLERQLERLTREPNNAPELTPTSVTAPANERRIE